MVSLPLDSVSRWSRSVAVCVAAMACLASAQKTPDSSAVKDSTPATRGAVVVEEEDIFTEMSKQGLRLGGGEASIVTTPKAAAPASPVDTAAAAAPSGDSTPTVAPVPAAIVDSSGTPMGAPNQPPSSYDRRGRYGKYGPPSSEGAVPPAHATPIATPSKDTFAIAPARVDGVRSVNFARNLKEYRSPKLAMLLSLLVPGTGQAYARSAWKSALFGVLEATIVGLSIGFNVAGGNARDDAHSYASKHYDPSATAFPAYYDSLKAYLEKIAVADTNYNPQEILDYFYYHYDTTRQFLDIYDEERRRKSTSFYDWITSTAFVHGWDDAQPAYMDMYNSSPSDTFRVSADGKEYLYVINPHRNVVSDRPDSAFMLIGLNGPDKQKRVFGYSDHQLTFEDMLSTSNDYYRVGGNVLFLLLVNHIASAIDAGITAKRYNDRLLGKQSLWERVHIDQAMVNTGTSISPSFALRLDF